MIINLISQPETQVLDYQTQQYKLFPLLASAYAMKFASHYMLKMYSEVIGEISEGNLDSLPEVR
jgi:acyl-CoA oxidase